ncbi:MAG: HNH endonuclease [Alphaproteobacteria bacterium]|nr:MAG: HNH endonuclease [Alphaproteobacteria bacterium]
MPLQACPALVLNADFRPLSYFPLSLWPWQETIKAVVLGRVVVLSEYERPIRSPRISMRLPSVVALRDYAPTPPWPAFTRFNVFLRDDFACQYCGARPGVRELTFDHVLARSQGGRTGWTNVVAACTSCNLQKGNRTLAQSGMRLRRPPWRPNSYELQAHGRCFPPNYLHTSWRDFLYWDAELETV